MDVLYGIENPLFLEERASKDPQYLTKTLLPWLIKYSVNIKKASKPERARAAVSQEVHADSEALIDMICQHFFADTPTFFALSYFGLYLDYRYPVGGTGVSARAAVGAISSRTAARSAPAARWLASLPRRIARSLRGRAARCDYRQLIWAADQRAFYRALGEPLPIRPVATTKATRRAQPRHRLHPDAVYRLRLLRRRKRSACGTHAFYTPDTERAFLPAGLAHACRETESKPSSAGSCRIWRRRHSKSPCPRCGMRPSRPTERRD